MSIAGSVPYLVVSQISGWVADRVDGLLLARGADYASALTVMIIPALSMLNRLDLAALAGVAAVLSGLEAFFLPALQANLPRLVSSAELTPMVSLLDSTDRLGRILGPGLIGLLGFVPRIQLFTLDAGSFLVSALCLTAIHRRRTSVPPRTSSAQARFNLTALTAGWRLCLGTPALRTATLLRGACNLAWPAFTLATPFIVARRYHQSVSAYGLVLAAFGAGNIIGTILAARVPQRLMMWICCTSWAAAGIGFLALALAPTYSVFLAATIGLGTCTPLANVTIAAYIAQSMPRPLLARVYTVQRVGVAAASTAGAPLVAWLISAHNDTFTLNTAGCAIVAASLIALAAHARTRMTGSQETTTRPPT